MLVARLKRTEMEKLLVFSLVAGLVAGNYYGDYYCKPGTDVMVHLFEWKWTDVQAECPLLADAGYCAVQVRITEGII